MAYDRFIYFENRKPTSAEVERILKNFFGDAGKVVRDGARWTVSLPGKPTAPLEGIEGALARAVRDDARWLEAYHHQGKGPDLDVITREQDEFVMALADGLVALFARFYKGRVEDD